MMNAMNGEGAEDLIGLPPLNPPRPAPQSGGALGMPRPSAAAAAIGAGPAMSLASKMMAFEKLSADISREIPELTNMLAPVIELMRDLGAARLADQQVGGVGATGAPGAAAPGMPGMGMGMPGAGPGLGLAPPPMI